MATAATTKAIRGALIFRLKNNPSVSALVPPERVFPQQVPAKTQWPYIRVGVPISTPERASCMDGRVTRLAVHVFAEGESPTDDICDAIAEAVDGAHFDVGVGSADISWISNTTIQDSSESDNFHGICQIEISFVA